MHFHCVYSVSSRHFIKGGGGGGGGGGAGG